MDLLPAILIGYTVGSLPIGFLVAQTARGVDLRQVGSGNVGAANVYRTGWLGFKGGKGVATASGVFGVLAPLPTAIAAAAFGLTVARTRFVSLGSIVATVLLPVIEWAMPGLRAVDIGATLVATLILFRHRGNVARLWSRTERALGT
jgi:glycerol-3-phosphate acyltransferase PlsY